jgi:hypothetical protein
MSPSAPSRLVPVRIRAINGRDGVPTITSTSSGLPGRPIVRAAGNSEAVNWAATAGARLDANCRLYTVYDQCY